jgi:hypothetical protein
MARKTADEGVVSRLAGRGEDAMTRLMDELGRNSVVTDALARAMSAKGRLDTASRTALGQVGLAAADDLNDLRKQVADLEKRLAKLEAGGKASSGTRSGRSSTTSTKSTSTSASSKSRSGSGTGTSRSGGSSGSSRPSGGRSNPAA